MSITTASRICLNHFVEGETYLHLCLLFLCLLLEKKINLRSYVHILFGRFSFGVGLLCHFT
jgi:hypothetical protein